jgi:hypothetical protein
MKSFLNLNKFKISAIILETILLINVLHFFAFIYNNPELSYDNNEFVYFLYLVVILGVNGLFIIFCKLRGYNTNFALIVSISLVALLYFLSDFINTIEDFIFILKMVIFGSLKYFIGMESVYQVTTILFTYILVGFGLCTELTTSPSEKLEVKSKKILT